MSFSDDGWGVHESEVNVGNPTKDNVAQDPVQLKVIEQLVKVSEPVEEKAYVIAQEKQVEETKNFMESHEDVEQRVETPILVQRQPPTIVDNVDNGSDDGWGASPMKREEFRAPVVSEAAASRLPPSTVQAPQSKVLPPVNDTIDIDIESPRELSPAPPTERRLLPPQVKSSALSRKGSDFGKSSEVKSFGVQKVVAPVADEWDIPTTKSSVDEVNVPTKSFGIQRPSETARVVKDPLKPTSFGEPGRSFGGAFGAPKAPTEFASNLSKRPVEQSSKPMGFGGTIEGTKQSELGSQKPLTSFGKTEAPINSFGSSDPPKQASNFGSDVQTRSSFGGGGAVRSSFGESKSTGFGGHDQTKTSDTPFAKSSGFGSDKSASSRGFGAGPTEKQVGFGVSDSGFGKQSSEFAGEQQKPLGFGQKPDSANKQFGGDSKFGDAQSSSQKPLGFGNTATASSAFGMAPAKERSSFGVSDEKPSSGFGKCSGFGMKLEPSSGGFGSSQAPGGSFGGSGFGNAQNNSSKPSFGNSAFGGANSTFGATGQFGKIDGGFGENEQKRSFGAFDGGNRGTGGEFGERSNGCRNCGEDGHSARECPNPKRSNACRNCGEEGHFSKECPSPRRSNACRNCGEEGHFSKECPNPKTERPCGNCKELGHYSKDCPQPRVPHGPCRNCGEEGHFAKDCTKERVRLEPTEPCRRCGEEGHWAYECPSRPRDLEGNVLVPYDVVFTPEVEMFDEAVSNDHRIDFDQKVVASMGEVDVPDMASFEAFKVLPQEVHDNLKRMKMNRPTPIQRASFFPILHGQDVVACAHTGSGKTLAFLIPLVINLLEDRANNHGVTDEKPSPRLLVVAPTRELASQTFNTARQVAYETGLKCGLAYGGYSRSANLQHLRSFDQLGILVATMGRLHDFIDSGEISLEKMRFVVLDEADRMVDSTDFGEEVCKILGPPEQRKNQTILFSASFSEHLQAEDLPKIVKQGYTMLQVDKFGTANEKIDQHMLAVARADKKTELYKLIGIDENTMTALPDTRVEKEKTLIFVNSVKFCDTLAANIACCGISCISMHSHQNQEQRDRTLDDFRRGKFQCMVASNVCARGLNIAGLDHVINYDMPDKNGFDEYVNRIGRTARAGFTGISTAFIDEESDREIIPSLVNVLTEAKKEVPEWLLNMNGESAEEATEGNDEQW